MVSVSVKDFVRVTFQSLFACVSCSLVVFSDPLPESYLMSFVIINEKSQTTFLNHSSNK